MADIVEDTLQHLLNQAAKRLSAVSDTAALDAEVLLCHCLGKNRSFLRAWPEHQPGDRQTAHFLDLIERRLQGLPIAYLTGEREFWSLTFRVSPAVLIPRPESELLIELGLARLPNHLRTKAIDLGTGSGILAITLAVERPQTAVVATDISTEALAIAKLNAEQLGANNVRFVHSNWFDAIVDRDFDLVISNPPYIAADDPHLLQGDVRFEPNGALVSADDGLKDIRLIAQQARRHLKPGGQLLIEHGYNQRTEVQAIFDELDYRQVTTHNDLSGHPRVTSGLWNPA